MAYRIALLLLLSCVCLASKTYAQYRLSGIVSSIGGSIVGATVQLSNTPYSTITDVNGTFVFYELPSGSYTVVVKAIGYEQGEKTITLEKSSKQINILLNEKNVMLDNVLVAGTRSSDKSGMVYTNLRAEDLAPLNLGQDVAYLVQQTPSVVATSDAGTGIGYTGVRIRGTDATRINVTLNGVPINDSESHAVYWVNMPDLASSTTSLQLQRGVGSSSNGAGAFGGSLHLQTASLKATPYADIDMGYGSFNTFRTNVQAGTGLLNKTTTFDIRLSRLSSDGFIDRASSNLYSLFFSGAYYGKRSMLRGTLLLGQEQTYQAWNGVPEARLKGDTAAMYQFAALNYWDEAKTKHLLESNSRTYNEFTYDNQVDHYNQHHAQLHYGINILPNLYASTALHYTLGKGYYEEYKPQQKLADYGVSNNTIYQISEGDTALVTQTDLIRRKWLDNDFGGLIYSLQYHRRRWQGTIGGGINRYLGNSFGEVIWAQIAANSVIRQRYYDSSGAKNDFNTYAKMEYTLKSGLTMTADLQYRYIKYAITGTDADRGDVDIRRKYHFFNPKIGLFYTPDTRHQCYASLAMAHREPTRGNFLDNNTLPEAEQLLDAEAGYRWRSTLYEIGANFYYMRYNNQLILTGNLNDVGEPIQQNVPNSYRTGVEITSILRPNSTITWQTNLTVSRNKIEEFTVFAPLLDYNYEYYGDTTIVYRNTTIAFSPTVVAASTLTYQPSFAKGLSASWLSKLVSEQFLDNTSSISRVLPGYWVNGLQLQWAFSTKIIPKIECKLLINNLFNLEYETNGYSYFLLFRENNYTPTNFNFYYPQAGINALGSISFVF